MKDKWYPVGKRGISKKAEMKRISLSVADHNSNRFKTFFLWAEVALGPKMMPQPILFIKHDGLSIKGPWVRAKKLKARRYHLHQRLAYSRNRVAFFSSNRDSLGGLNIHVGRWSNTKTTLTLEERVDSIIEEKIMPFLDFWEIGFVCVSDVYLKRGPKQNVTVLISMTRQLQRLTDYFDFYQKRNFYLTKMKDSEAAFGEGYASILQKVFAEGL